MIGYVTLGTNDLAKAAVFYDALARELGTSRMMENEQFIAWGTPGEARRASASPNPSTASAPRWAMASWWR